MDKRNIVLINCDQLSAQALSAWGNSYSTPNIDRIIHKGMRFERAYTNCPLCLPSRASFWTGLYPHQTGVLSNGRKWENAEVPDTTPAIGSVFSEAGYRTVHFGKQHDAGSLHGFEKFPVDEKEVEVEDPAWPVNYDTRYDAVTTEQAVSFLETYNDEAPFLAVADINNPHDICSWIGDFQGDNELILPESELPPLPGNLYIDEETFKSLPLPVQYICCAHNRQSQVSEWDEKKVQCYLAAYHHFIQRADRDIGKIIDALEKREDADNTLIVFMADHGDSMMGRWMATKHTSFYEETTHIPFVFRGPGVMQGTVHSLVSLLDLFPTLCGYAGLQIPDGLEGTDLSKCLKGDKGTVNEYVVSQWHTEWGFTVEPGRMVRTEKYKYTHYLEGEGEELYDLEEDPGEMKNLSHSGEHKSVLEEHRAILKQYIEKTADPFFSMEWKADEKWRSHEPGYRNHRGIAAPQ